MTELIKHSKGDRFLALLSYLCILFLIPLFIKNHKWVHNHAKQGLVLFLAGFLVWIPLLGWIWGVFLLVCWLIVIVKVLAGEPYWRIPILGKIADKIHI